MTYEKTNWQVGDTITAEKLNNADNIANAKTPLVNTTNLYKKM